MGFGAVTANDILQLYFNGTPIANIADHAASSPLTNLYVTMHTADPLPGGDQTTHEHAWTGHNRVAVAIPAGWTVTGEVVSPAGSITFASPSSSGEVETFWSVGTAASGTGKIIGSGPLTPNITIVSGLAPVITAASTVTLA